MTFLPVLALGSKIAYFSFNTSSCDAICDKTVVTLVQNETTCYNISSIEKN